MSGVSLLAGNTVSRAARILIVDDEPANVMLLHAMLRNGGFTEIRGITDSRLAVDAFDELRPDLVMLDLQMPHVDGFELLTRFRQRLAPGDYLPVLVLTADTTSEARDQALRGGARDFLTKPLDHTEVMLRTSNLLETRFLHLALKTENRSLEARLVHQAFHDALTGLANRALFRDRVEHALSRTARSGRMALLVADLDNFKSINDTLGHDGGDRVLEAVAERLQAATRGCDTVARVGGDEFAVLLDGLQDDADALIVADRITRALSYPVVLDQGAVRVHASIGLAHPSPGEGPDQLIRNADIAMYHAKDHDKGRTVIFEPAMYSALFDRVELEEDLRRAIAQEELRVVYQPIVRLDTGVISGVEALVRWAHPDGAERSPGSFIALAEETGMIVAIGRWVLGEACREASRWQCADGRPSATTLSVNVSPRQLHESGFVTFVQATLEETGLAPHRLTLELTEGVLLSNDAQSLEQLHQLKRLGVRLAIDDFGTGFSNLSYLQDSPLDQLKVDRAFVTRLTDGGDTAVATSILGLALALRLTTVAEGIETESQREQLMALGCTFGQGYLFSRPLSGAHLAALVGDLHPADPTTAPFLR